MEQKLMLNETVKNLLLCEFNPNETLSVLRSNPSIFMSWGVEKLVNVDGRGLMIKVNGHHHKGLFSSPSVGMIGIGFIYSPKSVKC